MKGGARPGAGRPKGTFNWPQLRDQLSQEQIDALVIKGIERAEAGDSIMLRFVLEQVFGKAPQPLTGDGGGPVQSQALRFPYAENEGQLHSRRKAPSALGA
jgi:hypothetical protein